MKTVCVLGNGASMAYNPGLSVGSLTTSLLQRFQEAGTGEAPEALARFAQMVSGRSDGQFEALLGPLSMTAEALRGLDGITGLVQQANEARAAVGTTSAFLAEVHRRGLAITLSLIADRSVGQSGGRWDEVVDSLGRALADLGDAADLTVATLNYDGLTHSALMEAWNDAWGQPTGQVADLAWGWRDQIFDVVPGHRIQGWPLREDDTLPSDRAAVLQLHGSLGWLRQPLTGAVWKFRLTDLRDAHYWDRLADGTTRWEPVVVLTNRKREAVLLSPFDLAYQVFVQRLIYADRWLVLGCSLGDEPVREAFRFAGSVRRTVGRPEPQVLIVDLDDQAAVLRVTLAEVTGYPVEAMAASGAGLPAAIGQDDWNSWASGSAAASGGRS